MHQSVMDKCQEILCSDDENISGNQIEKENIVGCYICLALFSNKIRLEIHMTRVHHGIVHEGKTPFKCSSCDYKCSQKATLIRHIATIHEGKKPFGCTVCDYKCSQKGALKTHIESVHEGKKPFKCSFCDYNCSIKAVLTTHISSVHEGKKPYNCSICHYRCTTNQSLIKHVTAVHEGKRPFECYICYYKFSQKVALTQHISSVHEGKTPFNCSSCDYKFSQKATLIRHIATIHEGKKPFGCTVCDYKCSQKGALKTHIESVHEGKKPFKCSFCDYNCSIKAVLTTHISSVHEGKKPYNCSICHYRCTTNQSLIKHVTAVHEGKRPFKCSVCDYNCSVKSQLTQHIAIVHEGKKPYTCSSCDYNCSEKGNLTRHIESVHEGNKPFKCYICNYNFSGKSHLTKHITSVHQGPGQGKKLTFNSNSSEKVSLTRHIMHDETQISAAWEAQQIPAPLNLANNDPQAEVNTEGLMDIEHPTHDNEVNDILVTDDRETPHGTITVEDNSMFKGVETGTGSPPSSKNGQFKAAVATNINPKSHTVVSIHEGQRNHGPITKEEWDHIFGELNRKIALACCQPNWDPHDRIEWAMWTKQRGLLACTSDSMKTLVAKTVGDLTFNGKDFRAWRSEEQEYENLLTCILPKGVTEFFNNEEIMTIFMAQNGLNGIGEHGSPAFGIPDKKGIRKLTMGVSVELGDKIKSLGGHAGIGAFTAKTHIKKANQYLS